MDRRRRASYELAGRNTDGPLGQLYRLLSKPRVHLRGVEQAIFEIINNIYENPTEENISVGSTAIEALEETGVTNYGELIAKEIKATSLWKTANTLVDTPNSLTEKHRKNYFARQHIISALGEDGITTYGELIAKAIKDASHMNQQVKANYLTGTSSDVKKKVFLSYAREDFYSVKPIYDKLKAQGLSPWLDVEDLLPGMDWEREIVKEIKQSHFVLFCLSEKCLNKRGFVQKELRTALQAFDEIPLGQTYLIPVRLEECEVPVELSKYHIADVFRDGEFDKLLVSISKT